MKGPLLPTCQFCSFLQSLLYVLGEREIQERGGRKEESEKGKVRKERKTWGEKDETRDNEKEEVRKEKKWGRGANLYRTWNLGIEARFHTVKSLVAACCLVDNATFL